MDGLSSENSEGMHVTNLCPVILISAVRLLEHEISANIIAIDE